MDMFDSVAGRMTVDNHYEKINWKKCVEKRLVKWYYSYIYRIIHDYPVLKIPKVQNLAPWVFPKDLFCCGDSSVLKYHVVCNLLHEYICVVTIEL